LAIGWCADHPPRGIRSNIAQTPGLRRRAAVTTQNSGATKLWAGTFSVEATAKTGAHHHVPPYVPYQEINPSPDVQLQCVLARSGQKGLVFNLDIEGVETPELVRWIDDLHQ
jgi:uncharacterized RmlC-like cupin family protein